MLIQKASILNFTLEKARNIISYKDATHRVLKAKLTLKPLDKATRPLNSQIQELDEGDTKKRS